ncbi:hypothetical protein ABZ896_21645 [Streptomyces sp. NPDC047072]|uniref:hypothetical protein n=1 Tax=Streptomyces sp. NPDC047072 TaxID=3154809 RepID=UPI0033C2FDE7
MTVFRCANCQQSLTSEVLPGEPLRGPERPPSHEVVPRRVAPGTFKLKCGHAGQDGPNLVCVGCGVEVATRESDCWTDNLVALIAAAVTDGSTALYGCGLAERVLSAETGPAGQSGDSFLGFERLPESDVLKGDVLNLCCSKGKCGSEFAVAAPQPGIASGQGFLG